jgi:hypothetical protein
MASVLLTTGQEELQLWNVILLILVDQPAHGTLDLGWLTWNKSKLK